MSYTSTGGLPTIPRLAVAGVDEGAPDTTLTTGAAGSLTSLTLPTQAVAPAVPASGVVLYANSSGRLSWRSASDTFSRSIIVTATANRTFTAPDADFTFAGQNLANTFTLANTFQAQTTIPLGSAASPAINFTGTSSGLFSSGGALANISINGTERFRFAASTLTIAHTAGEYSASFDTFLSRKAAANWQLGTADVASPVAQTLSVQSVVAGTTDTAGANWIQRASAGTGTGLGGQWIIQLAPPSASTGSAQNSFVTALYARTSAGHTGTFLRIGNSVSGPDIYAISGTSSGTASSSGIGLGFYNYYTSQTDDYAFSFTGANRTPASGTSREFSIVRTFAPTSGTAVYNQLHLVPVINQTGGANGITRGLYINPTLTAAADFRALEIADGNVVLPKTVTAGGTTGAQTINKVTGSVNFAAAATSLVVTDSLVTTSSIIIATVASNDTTMKSVAVVAAAGSFTIYPNAAPTAETRVNFIVTN